MGRVGQGMRFEVVRTPAMTARIPAPFGSLVLHWGPRGLRAVDLSLEPDVPIEQELPSPLQHAAREFRGYFRDAAFEFSLPVDPDGTLYQRRVWDALRHIPCGATLSYAALANRLCSGARAVAGACRANPLPLVVPCHRVVGRSGLGGYCGTTRGAWAEVKRWLLDHERNAVGC